MTGDVLALGVFQAAQALVPDTAAMVALGG